MDSTDSSDKDWKQVTLDIERDWRNPLCYYCGTPAVSKEHLPPDNLYACVQRNLPMLTVPACINHNNAYSQLDDQFRSIIASYCAPSSSAAMALLNSKVVRANARNPKFTKAIYDEVETADLWTLRGIYGGIRKIRFTFTPGERACLLNMYDRLTRSIYWQSNGMPTTNLKIKLLDNQLPWDRDFIQQCMQGFKLAPLSAVGHSDVFKLKVIGVGSKAEALVIWTCFFDKLSMVSLAMSPEVVKHWRYL
ncbi:MAG: hypothetical protein PHZ00_07745 [Candidatus Peribacteraceae bacterium]|nr:hypothetical protein [Candidatus Peribacteraceae bacterium]